MLIKNTEKVNEKCKIYEEMATFIHISKEPEELWCVNGFDGVL